MLLVLPGFYQPPGRACKRHHVCLWTCQTVSARGALLHQHWILSQSCSGHLLLLYQRVSMRLVRVLSQNKGFSYISTEWWWCISWQTSLPVFFYLQQLDHHTVPILPSLMHCWSYYWNPSDLCLGGNGSSGQETPPATGDSTGSSASEGRWVGMGPYEARVNVII